MIPDYSVLYYHVKTWVILEGDIFFKSEALKGRKKCFADNLNAIVFTTDRIYL